MHIVGRKRTSSVRSGGAEALEALGGLGAPLGARDKDGQTWAHWAVEQGHAEEPPILRESWIWFDVFSWGISVSDVHRPSPADHSESSLIE